MTFVIFQIRKLVMYIFLLQIIAKTKYFFKSKIIYFLFLLECLRWGPTSLQTVMQSFSFLAFTVCTMLGAENKNKKYIILLHT